MRGPCVRESKAAEGTGASPFMKGKDVTANLSGKFISPAGAEGPRSEREKGVHDPDVDGEMALIRDLRLKRLNQRV